MGAPMTLDLIGAGFGRTGTMSLKLALEQLGLGPCYHMVEVFQKPQTPDQWIAVARGRPDWEAIFDGYRATADWPSATYYAELAAAFSDAKVILTVRDPAAWYASTQATIFRWDGPTPPSEPFLTMIRETVGTLFDQRIHDREHVIGVYERHNARVRATIAPERLLVYQLADGWVPLCAFLGVPIPEGGMPKVNTTEEFQARASTPA